MGGLLKALSTEHIRRASAAAAEALFDSPLWARAETVYTYAAMLIEMQTDAVLVKAGFDGKRCAVPRIEHGDLVFRVAGNSPDDWTLHPYGMREPSDSAPLVDRGDGSETLVLVPGLAFDETGGRLGRGKGYYDRFLAGLLEENGNARIVGFGFEIQIVESVPVTGHDVRMQALVTERGFRPVRATRPR